eukprot:CAMPEP_0184863540 /NCGR_PEP_ID=MMETSP0580-20130426/11512_1 /TAXON_ID=1118495 /ORGANISM="Dactyliosolen fragilissimus" /LENGTH=442 /DNA_ID=CAMNT_0027361927 /DNA_START=54 /DNA_END=1382 /DNA_ORIENTATION=-
MIPSSFCCVFSSLFLLFCVPLNANTIKWSKLITLHAVDVELNVPVGIVSAKDGSNRLYLLERDTGLIKIMNKKTRKIYKKPFLNIKKRLGVCDGYCAERGLLGLAFAPDFETSGVFYVNYTRQASLSSPLYTIVSRFTSKSVKRASPNTEEEILRFEQPYPNHNGGGLQFGPDGYLYIATGDGGYRDDPLLYGQDLTTFHGKILRIDVTSQATYVIPSNNPFVNHISALPEIWAYGIRNAWRISFDVDGNLFIADVGQNHWEEVNFQSVDSGGGENYGWNVMEGAHCFQDDTDSCDKSPYIKPVIEYSHSVGCSITGGFRYRGSKVKDLIGMYIYSDYCSGTIWAAEEKEYGTWKSRVIFRGMSGASTFGEDSDGELYLATLSFTGSGDKMYSIENICSDDPNFKTGSNTCAMISKKSSSIKDEFCGRKKIRKNCRKTCTKC